MTQSLNKSAALQVKTSRKEWDKTEDDLKSLQSVGQIIGEVLRQLDEERCAPWQCSATASQCPVLNSSCWPELCNIASVPSPIEGCTHPCASASCMAACWLCVRPEAACWRLQTS